MKNTHSDFEDVFCDLKSKDSISPEQKTELNIFSAKITKTLIFA